MLHELYWHQWHFHHQAISQDLGTNRAVLVSKGKKRALMSFDEYSLQTQMISKVMAGMAPRWLVSRGEILSSYCTILAHCFFLLLTMIMSLWFINSKRKRTPKNQFVFDFWFSRESTLELYMAWLQHTWSWNRHLGLETNWNVSAKSTGPYRLVIRCGVVKVNWHIQLIIRCVFSKVIWPIQVSDKTCSQQGQLDHSCWW